MTGDTKLKRAAGTSSKRGSANPPKELVNMKVTFSELVAEGSNGSLTTRFGTVEETVPLRRQGAHHNAVFE